MPFHTPCCELLSRGLGARVRSIHLVKPMICPTCHNSISVIQVLGAPCNHWKASAFPATLCFQALKERLQDRRSKSSTKISPLLAVMRVALRGGRVGWRGAKGRQVSCSIQSPPVSPNPESSILPVHTFHSNSSQHGAVSVKL